MNADQFFFLVFCTLTKREVFGLITFYYTDVLLYTVLFGLTMFFVSKHSINNCMLYRDTLLAIVALLIHISYVLTLNQLILIGNLGLYVIYLVADWKNDTITHIGMKVCGKIKDDDSFEGDFPMNMPRTMPNIKDEYQNIPRILEKHKERYERDLKHHRIFITLHLHKRRMENNKENWFDDDELFRKVEVNMRFATAVYKHIFFLKECIETGKNTRENLYHEAIREL